MNNARHMLDVRELTGFTPPTPDDCGGARFALSPRSATTAWLPITLIGSVSDAPNRRRHPDY